MGIRSLAQSQWAIYPHNHVDPANLRLHLWAVPLFLAGNLVAVSGIVGGILVGPFLWGNVAFGALLSAVAMLAQGKGHAREATPPEPFTSVGNAVGRILLEQWWTFPRFVVSGGWRAALRQAA